MRSPTEEILILKHFRERESVRCRFLLRSPSFLLSTPPPLFPLPTTNYYSPGMTLVRYSLVENAFLLASTMLVTLQQKKAATDENSIPRHESAIG